MAGKKASTQTLEIQPTNGTRKKGTARDPGLNAVARILRTLDDLEEHQLTYIAFECDKRARRLSALNGTVVGLAAAPSRRYFPPGPAQRALQAAGLDGPQQFQTSGGGLFDGAGVDPEE